MKIILMTLMTLILSVTSFGYDQTTIDRYNAISNMGSVAERKVYFMGLSDSDQATIWKYHLDHKIAIWTLNQTQTDAMTALRDAITSTAASNAESFAPNSSIFNNLNNTLTAAEGALSSGQVTELRTLGDYENPSNVSIFDFDETIYQDEESSEFYAMQCPRGRFCYSVCQCAVGSFCRTCIASFNCALTQDGCGCLWLWTCNGRREG